MIREQTVRPLTDLTNDLPGLLDELKQSSEPILLTVDGQAQLIVQDPGSYQKLIDQIERFEKLESVRRGIAESMRGEGRPMEQFFDELEAEVQEIDHS